MRSKKLFLPLILLLIAGMLFSACGKTAVPGRESVQAATESVPETAEGTRDGGETRDGGGTADKETEKTPETAEAEPVPEQELPDISKALLIALPAVWVLIGLYTVWEKKKNKRKN